MLVPSIMLPTALSAGGDRSSRITVDTDRGGYLVQPDTIAAPGFDPSELVEFSSLVMNQDIVVCERAQLGAGSRAFAQGGVYPYQDRFVHDFDQRYLEAMGQR